VNADGAGYLVSAVDPERYTFMGTVDTFAFAGKRLVVADRFAVSAYDANLSRVWNARSVQRTVFIFIGSLELSSRGPSSTSAARNRFLSA